MGGRMAPRRGAFKGGAGGGRDTGARGGGGSREGDLWARAGSGMDGAMTRALLALALAFLVPALPVRAEIPADLVRMEMLPGWRAEGGRHIAGLRLTLAPGWKTYWRSPGEAGLAPVLDFGASQGVAAVEPRWPVPRVFHLGGMRSIGYGDGVTIPLEVTLAGPGPARLEGVAEIGVCHEICVPVRLPFAVDLPAAGARDPRIAAALVDRPLTAEEAQARATCAVAPDGRGMDLTLRVAMPPLGPDEAVVVESADPSLWLSEPVARREGGELVAHAEAVARGGGPVALDRSGLRITVLADGRAVDIRGCGAG
jgi:DsbC/DsbD-like thiol-disulfide interchange protein